MIHCEGCPPWRRSRAGGLSSLSRNELRLASQNSQRHHLHHQPSGAGVAFASGSTSALESCWLSAYEQPSRSLAGIAAHRVAVEAGQPIARTEGAQERSHARRTGPLVRARGAQPRELGGEPAATRADRARRYRIR
jgi:hypothetical protein